MQQAVTNLLQNAIQYYEGTGLVKLRGFRKGANYLIQVSNPGPTLPTDKQKWLFERFYRADSSRSRATGGTGLGLAIVKEIVVTHHEGDVSVSSLNNVHTFTISLPKSHDKDN
nr:ATP-binding protein [Salipaludibacillus keqinensis]